MATISFSKSQPNCAGGGHVHIQANVNGGAERQFMMHVSQLDDSISDEEVVAFARVILRLKKTADGLTNSQINLALTAGFSIVL